MYEMTKKHKAKITLYIHGFFFRCLFGGFRPIHEFFTHIEMSPLPVKACNFFHMLGTYGHMNSEGSLAFHTYCDTGHPLKVISQDQ